MGIHGPDQPRQGRNAARWAHTNRWGALHAVHSRRITGWRQRALLRHPVTIQVIALFKAPEARSLRAAAWTRLLSAGVFTGAVKVRQALRSNSTDSGSYNPRHLDLGDRASFRRAFRLVELSINTAGIPRLPVCAWGSLAQPHPAGGGFTSLLRGSETLVDCPWNWGPAHGKH